MVNTKVIIEVEQLILTAVLGVLPSSSSYSVAVHRARPRVFPVVMHRCESWTLNKAEHQRMEAFDLWWRRLLKSLGQPGDQSVLKEINPGYSLEGLMLKLRLQYFGHLMQRGNSLREDPDVEKDWRQKDKGAEESLIVSLTQWTWIWANWEIVEDRRILACFSPWRGKELDTT